MGLKDTADITRAPSAWPFHAERPAAAAFPSSSAASALGLSAWQGDRVRAHIEAQLDRRLPAIELATLVRLSASHFSRAFKARFGSPPHAYVLQRRIERAKALMLSHGNLQLAEIALICGLSDQSHLSRVFRHLVGETPKTWRTRHLGQVSCPLS